MVRRVFWLKPNKNSFFQATRKEQVDTVERLIGQGTMRSGYYLMLLLATLIVTPGLFLDNVSVLIGGMILAPLLIPILSLSLSLVTGNLQGILRSLRILLLSIAIVFAASAAVTLVLSTAYNRISFPHDIQPAIYVFIAFCSGVAGAFAWVKEELASAIAGVATSVALLPPLCVAGIGLALSDMTLLESSLIVFTANLLGLTLAAFLVFWVLGFLKSAPVEEKAIKKNDDA